jgi:hypothetical protein
MMPYPFGGLATGEIMREHSVLPLALGKGERQSVLVEAGSVVLLVAGQGRVRGPLQWIAEQMVAESVCLGSEQNWVAEQGGWIEIEGLSLAELAIISPAILPFWQRLGNVSWLWERGLKNPQSLVKGDVSRGR